MMWCFTQLCAGAEADSQGSPARIEGCIQVELTLVSRTPCRPNLTKFKLWGVAQGCNCRPILDAMASPLYTISILLDVDLDET